MLERMDDFFAARLDGYETKMLREVARGGYAEMAKLIPRGAERLLDLGCGTGLELDEIFKLYPDIAVTGIDLTSAMLEKLREKFPDKRIDLICASYLDYDFGENVYDCAVSFETMHHLTHEEKIALYANIRKALKPSGCYIEGDYMVHTQAEEDYWREENRRIRAAQGIPDGEFYHYDTPCSADNQVQLLSRAGFAGAEKVWSRECTVIIVARL
jgi:SAM-dependent methyltransferase